MDTDLQTSAPLTSSWEVTKRTNDIMDELHALRAEHAAQFDYDVRRIYEDLKRDEMDNPMRRSDLKPVLPRSREGE